MDLRPTEKAAHTRVIELYIALLKDRKPMADVQREIASIAAQNGIDDLKLNELQNKAIDRSAKETKLPPGRPRRYGPSYRT